MTYGDYQIFLNFRQSYGGTGASGLLTLPAVPPSKNSLTSGTGVGQVDNAYSGGTETAAAAVVTKDLTAMSGIFGTVDFTTGVNLLYFKNLDPVHSINFGGGSNDQTFGKASNVVETVPPGGELFRSNPTGFWSVTSGSTNEITIDPGSNTVEYQLFISGV